MKIPLYLAMTEEEIAQTTPLPEHIVHMGTHFNEKDGLLTNLPSFLQYGSILMIDDRVAVRNDNLDKTIRQITSLWEKNQFDGVLLDFQQPYSSALQQFCNDFMKAFPHKAAVSKQYYTGDGIVFCSLAPDEKISTVLSELQGHEIWLDLSAYPAAFQIDEKGCSPCKALICDVPWTDSDLNCHYNVVLQNNCIKITIKRTLADCSTLLDKASKYGVTAGFCLYQEINDKTAPDKIRGGH